MLAGQQPRTDRSADRSAARRQPERASAPSINLRPKKGHPHTLFSRISALCTLKPDRNCLFNPKVSVHLFPGIACFRSQNRHLCCHWFYWLRACCWTMKMFALVLSRRVNRSVSFSSSGLVTRLKLQAGTACHGIRISGLISGSSSRSGDSRSIAGSMNIEKLNLDIHHEHRGGLLITFAVLFWRRIAVS